jgi:hypothetical protein
MDVLLSSQVFFNFMPLTWLKKPDVVFAGKGGMVEQSDIIRKRTVYARERQSAGRKKSRIQEPGCGSLERCEIMEGS